MNWKHKNISYSLYPPSSLSLSLLSIIYHFCQFFQRFRFWTCHNPMIRIYYAYTHTHTHTHINYTPQLIILILTLTPNEYTLRGDFHLTVLVKIVLSSFQIFSHSQRNAPKNSMFVHLQKKKQYTTNNNNNMRLEHTSTYTQREGSILYLGLGARIHMSLTLELCISKYKNWDRSLTLSCQTQSIK